jgi:hypothetical protein
MHDRNHSIDQQMREVLDQGTERLNLGAWANMERMLDGQNPYAAPEEEDKKRGFWLFGLLALVIGIASLGAYQLMHPTKQTPNFAQNIPTDKVVKSENTNNPSKEVTNANTTENGVQNTSNISQESSDNSSTNLPIVENEKSKEAVNESNNKNNSLENNNKTINNNKDAFDNGTSKQKEFKAEADKIVNNEVSKNINDKKSEAIKENKLPDNNDLIVGESDITALPTINKSIDKKNKKQKLEQTELKVKIAKPNLTTDAKDQVTTQITKPKDSTTFVRKIVSKAKDENGIVTDKVKISVTKSEKVNKLENNIAEPEETTATANTPNLEKMNKAVENKRSVQLSKEDQEKADAKPSAIVKKKKAVEPEEKLEKEIVKTKQVTEEKTNSVTETKPKVKNGDATNWANKAIENIIETTKKIGYLPIFNQKIYVNPGIFGGINGSFFNTEHNYGGFQAGTNLMMQIAKNWSFLPSLGFYYRNNGGYSIKDNSTIISNKSSVLTPDFKSNIYNYQVDSTTINYNFKHTYSVEMPIVLQYHRKDWSFYGGLNMAYGFKMNTNTKTTGYSNQINVTMPIDSVYAYPTSAQTFYKSSDFQSRFGLGYVAGFSYDFHPNLYFDAKITKNVWDNSGTASAIAMSNKMFRVPSIQLGISYRFKEKERARY